MIEKNYSKKFNIKRKELLQRLDEQEDSVDNLTLSFYGLTTYIKSDSETLFSTLAEKTLFLNNQLRMIRHLLPKEQHYFMPEQIRALNHLSSYKKTIIKAPTSFGKTLIVKEYIFNELPENVVYIVPTNALSYELEKSFKENKNFNNEYDIFDKTFGNNSEKDKRHLFIGTQEKFLEIYKELPKIDFFVIDEAYKLQEKCNDSRGYKLSKAFFEIAIKKSEKVCLLTPNCTLIGFDDYGFKVFDTTFNAVDKKFHVIPKESFYDELNSLSKRGKTILYCGSPESIEKTQQYIKKHAKPNQSLLNHLINDFHKEWSVTKLFEKGVLCHHGQMPKYLQNKMIRLFLEEDNYKLLLGTNSISEGINTPTKHLFINPKTQLKEKLLIKNTFGRAGRLGKYPIGHIYSTKNLQSIDEYNIEVVLAISDANEQSILLDTEDENKTKDFCKTFGITEEVYKSIISKNHISQFALGKMLTCLKDFSFPSPSYLNTISLAYKYEEYIGKRPFYVTATSICAKSTIGDDSYRTLLDKINFFKRYYKGKEKYNDSKIVDQYMKFLYSTLDYSIMPIVNVALDLKKEIPDWGFGINVIESINNFFYRYNSNILGIDSNEEYSEDEMKVISSLREYGIGIKDAHITKEIVDQIVSELKVRFSTYDIMNVIKKLASEDIENQYIFKAILDKYLS